MTMTGTSMRAILHEHEGHRVMTSSAIGDAVTTVHTDTMTDEEIGWRYAGYSVTCLADRVSLSEQWG